METQQATVVWKKDLQFEGRSHSARINLDSHVDEYQEGTGPKRLLLVALAGCTGMDVASMLPKMRVPFSRFIVSAEGVQTEDHPKVYKSIHVTYELDVDPDQLDKVEMAVEKSVTKYCGVHAMLAQAAEITHEIKLIEGPSEKLPDLEPTGS